MLIFLRTNSLFRPPNKWNIHSSTCWQIWGTYETQTPTNIKEVRHFLGLTGYYQNFICNYADITHPLNCIMCKSQPFVWTPECQASFDMLHSWLTNTPIVLLSDPNKPYLLFTDMSKFCYSGVLMQASTEDWTGILAPLCNSCIQLVSEWTLPRITTFLYMRCDPYLPHLATFLQSKLRYLGLDKCMICLYRLRQAYMLAALNTKDACSK